MAIKSDGVISRDPAIVSEVLADYFENISAHSRYPDNFRRTNNNATQELHQLNIPEDQEQCSINCPFNVQGIIWALNRGKGKSEGVDEVGYPLLSHLPPIGKRKFLDLLNNEWKNRTIPETWHHSLVIPIPKKETGDGSPSSFRPISLTCCASKVMERMVNRRLLQWLYKGNYLDSRQHAFRPGYGVGTYLAELGQILHKGSEQGHVEVATLDIAKAYNRAWTPGVIQQLIDWGLTGNIIHYLRNFLCNRTFQVCVGNHRSQKRKEETGVTQGSIIAVTIFLVAMNNVFVNIPKNTFALSYADDILLIVPGRTQKKIRKTIQAAVTSIVKWTTQNGFELAAHKCELLHICEERHQILSTPVMANGEHIPIKRSLRVLGVFLDRKLSFVKHVDETKQSCKTRLNLLRTIARRHNKCNRTTLLKVAASIIDSRLLFGAELLCMAPDQTIANLATTHNQAIRIASGLLPCTPADIACAESGVLPFRYKFAKTVCRRATSLLERKRPTREETRLHREANKLLRQYANKALPPVARIHWSGTKSWNLPIVKTDNSIQKNFRAGSNSPALRATVSHLLRTKYANHHVRYSDGSKAEGKVGIGVAGDISLSFRLPNTCSIFSAEAIAAFHAATAEGAKPRLVITDSSSVLAALKSENSKHPWIQAMQTNSEDVTFMWIPGHCGVPGNEEADRLANSGRGNLLGHKAIPGQDVKTHIAAILHNSWAQQWGNERAHLRKIKMDTGKWTDLSLQRDQRIISRLRTGYTRFAYRLCGGGPFKIQCPICNTHNTVEHVVLNCPQFHQARLENRIADSIRTALEDDPGTATQILHFLKQIGLYYET